MLFTFIHLTGPYALITKTKLKQECITVGCVHRDLQDREPPWTETPWTETPEQRFLWTEASGERQPLDRDAPWAETPSPWTETPSPWAETPSPWTETPLQGQRPPGHVTCGCWDPV